MSDFTKMNLLVNEMIRDHEGGEVFFDHLDEKLRETSWLDLMVEKVEELEQVLKFDYIICSGKFGRMFATYCVGNNNIIVVNGGLRNYTPLDEFETLIENPTGTYIFIDDSFYSGTTRNVIDDYISSIGGTLLHTHVLYDGSRETDKKVTSLFRYYTDYKKLKKVSITFEFDSEVKNEAIAAAIKSGVYKMLDRPPHYIARPGEIRDLNVKIGI